MYPLWKVAVGVLNLGDRTNFSRLDAATFRAVLTVYFQSYSVALNGPKKSTLPYCSQLMSSIAGAANAGACSCYSCV